MKVLATIRPDERQNVWAAFAMLFGLIASHSVLETARDALFLAQLPPSRLPFVYLGIALASLLVTQLQARLGRSLNRRRALSVWCSTAAVITLLFWLGLQPLGAVGFYALYVWSGVLTTLVLVHFWVLLGAIFTVTQAKRVYSLIGAGSVLGAIAGSGTAGVLARFIDAEQLLLVSTAGFAATAIIPAWLEDVGRSGRASYEAYADSDGPLEAVRYIVRHPYARRLVVFSLVTTAAVTIADYIFKSTVATEVPADELGSFFGTFYFCLNVASFLVQVGLVGWIFKRFDLSVALSVLPALFVLGGGGMALTASLTAALVIKGADGGLRYSLHRTANEFLFLPLTDRARERIKSFVDVVGQRGGQAVASLLILLLAMLGAPPAVFAIVLIVLGVLWIGGSVDVHRHYVDLFRGRVYDNRHLDEFPELDMASLETLIAALDSENDAEVVAALDVLEREGKSYLVPGLILYHPSDDVVDRALSLFTRIRRENVGHVAERLLQHASPRVRAAAVATTSVLLNNENQLRLMLSIDDSAEVRATIMVNLIASGAIIGGDARDALDAIIQHGSTQAKVALTEAIARREAVRFGGELVRLSEDPDRQVRAAVARAMGAIRSPQLLPVLLNLLAGESTRTAARRNLVAYGSEALDFLVEILRDPEVPELTRWQIPATLVQFDQPGIVVPVLLERLEVERSGMVRYRSIRALEVIVAEHPGIDLDERILDQSIAANVSRAYRYLNRRLGLEHGVSKDAQCGTEGHTLLHRAMRDKEEHAVDRVFRLLGLKHRRESFVEIRKGLASNDRTKRASSIELIENTLLPPLRGAVVGLVDDAADEDRLSQAGSYHQRRTHDYASVLAELLDESSSIAIRAISVYHIGELKLQSLADKLEALRGVPELEADIELALRRLRGEEPVESIHAG